MSNGIGNTSNTPPRSTELPLWIYDSGCTTEQIERGVWAARDVLAQAGVSAQAALAASLARANDEPFEAILAEVWDEAERAALIEAGAGEHAILAAG